MSDGEFFPQTEGRGRATVADIDQIPELTSSVDCSAKATEDSTEPGQTDPVELIGEVISIGGVRVFLESDGTPRPTGLVNIGGWLLDPNPEPMEHWLLFAEHASATNGSQRHRDCGFWSTRHL